MAKTTGKSTQSGKRGASAKQDDAIAILTADHKKVQQLFKQFEKRFLIYHYMLLVLVNREL